MTMILYQDKYPHSSRVIWVEYNGENNTIRIDLQDLGEDFEYERSMSDISLDEILKALGLEDIEALYAFLLGNYSSKDAIDRICDEVLTKYNITFAYYAG